MINLLPPELKASRRYGRKNAALFGYSISLMGTGALTAAIMIAGIQFIGSEEPSLRKSIENTQVEITTLEGEVAGIETVAERLKTAKAIDDSSVKFSELIPKIGAVLPEGVVLNALSLSGGITDPLQLDVNLVSADLAPVMIRNLVDSELFEAADIATLTPIGSDSSDSSASTSTYSFNASISASFTGTAEAARKAAAAEAAKKAAADAAAAGQQGAQ